MDRKKHLLCTVRIGFHFVRWRVSPARTSGMSNDVLIVRTTCHSDGKYGLWVDKVFQNGSSATSPAYANEVLCAPEGSGMEKVQFDCMALEVWATSG